MTTERDGLVERLIYAAWNDDLNFGGDVRQLLREAADALSAAQRLEPALRKARTFIEYARYELEPGLAKFGDQFPKQEDADKVMALIDAALLSERSPQQEEKTDGLPGTPGRGDS